MDKTTKFCHKCSQDLPRTSFNKTQKRSYKSSKTSSGSKCYRCGRSGHFSSNCYASKHVKGYYL